MVRINRVYTRTGDRGTTMLIGGRRSRKDAPRIEAYGQVDEVNAILGLCKFALEKSKAGPKLVTIMTRIQNELFNLGAELATPDPKRRAKQPSINSRHVNALEREIDELNEDLPELRSFVLPGGGEASAYLHLARTVCRRAERHAITLAHSQNIGEYPLMYLNRLSDALFVFGRYAAKMDEQSEPLWEPEKT